MEQQNHAGSAAPPTFSERTDPADCGQDFVLLCRVFAFPVPTSSGVQEGGLQRGAHHSGKGDVREPGHPVRADLKLELAPSLFHIEQEFFHRARPGLKEFFFEKGEFAQVMNVTEGLSEGISLIAEEPFMDAGPSKPRGNPDGVQGLSSSTRMSCIVGQLIR